jgi:uncharacterized protein
MALINDDMRDIVATCGLGYAATVCPDGTPNLSPKGSLAVWDDDHLYFADIASPQTIENLRHNPGIELNAVDIIKRRGYRFKGTGEIHDDGPVFDLAAKVLREGHGPQYPCEHAVLVKVDAVRPVLSPAYVFNEVPPPEEKLSAIWRAKLGVQAPSEPGGAGSVVAYEQVLTALLNFQSVQELRDVFARAITQQAAGVFATALDRTRDRGQPDEFALADAIEGLLIQNAADESISAEDLERLFNDPEHHQMPSQELTSRVEALWDRAAAE